MAIHPQIFVDQFLLKISSHKVQRTFSSNYNFWEIGLELYMYSRLLRGVPITKFLHFFLETPLLRCSTASRSNTMFSLVGPTKVKAF